jgi:hypothetical protein
LSVRRGGSLLSLCKRYARFSSIFVFFFSLAICARTADSCFLFSALIQAEDFSAYEEYCSGHDEALAVIRSVELSPEWTAYERKCSALTASRERPTLSDLLSYAASTATNPNSSSSAAVTEFDWSFSSRSGTELPRTASSSSLHYDMASANRAAAAAAEGGGTSRLMLRDLLIKPIQRICRYPLVLASLLGCQVDYEKRDGEEEVGEDLERALGSMRVVAEGVDEATRRKASKERTKLILQRMEPHMVSRLASVFFLPFRSKPTVN